MNSGACKRTDSLSAWAIQHVVPPTLYSVDLHKLLTCTPAGVSGHALLASLQV